MDIYCDTIHCCEQRRTNPFLFGQGFSYLTSSWAGQGPQATEVYLSGFCGVLSLTNSHTADSYRSYLIQHGLQVTSPRTK